jgi:RNA polymerase sigma-70 factor (ECF subfamily)
MDEASLIRKAAQGEVSAFDALVDRHSPAIMAVVRARTGDLALAEEIVQDAFVRMFRHLPRFRGESSLRTWLVRVALNLATDAARRDRRRFEFTLESVVECAAADESAEQVSIHSEQTGRVRHALRQLPEAMRVAISLRYDAGLSYAEIARVLDVPIGTVASRIASAIGRLRVALGSEGTQKRSG